MPRKANPVAVKAEVSPRIWRNLPPARVWVYRKAEAQSHAPVFKAGTGGVDRFERHAEKLYLGLKKEARAVKLRRQRVAKARLRGGAARPGTPTQSR
jgi:phosphatidylethanolamine/phosphatidyl-N-methylethanolamine N-methyltransferase